MTPFAVAGIQMYLGMQNNVEQMRSRLEVLMHLYPWTQMVMFSELAPHGPALQSAQPAGGADEQAFQEMARRHQLWLLPGSMFEKRDGAIYNTTPVINPEGEVVARYRKMFPFAPYEDGTTPGEEFCVFDVPEVGRFGVAICYDIWFPEVARTLTSMGAEVIMNPVLAHFMDRPCRPRHRPGDRGDVPDLRLPHQRPRGRRQRPVGDRRSGRARAAPGAGGTRRSCRSRSTSTSSAASASAGCSGSASR